MNVDRNCHRNQPTHTHIISISKHPLTCGRYSGQPHHAPQKTYLNDDVQNEQDVDENVNSVKGTKAPAQVIFERVDKRYSVRVNNGGIKNKNAQQSAHFGNINCRISSLQNQASLEAFDRNRNTRARSFSSRLHRPIPSHSPLGCMDQDEPLPRVKEHGLVTKVDIHLFAVLLLLGIVNLFSCLLIWGRIRLEIAIGRILHLDIHTTWSFGPANRGFTRRYKRIVVLFIE